VVNIEAGELHTCAVIGTQTCGNPALATGSVWCWGLNDVGELGDAGPTSGISYGQTPTPVQAQLTANITQVTAGLFYTCAMNPLGLTCWGDNSAGQLGIGSTSDSHVPAKVRFF
jgi:alpha-tubulin suppressor-like RCC1 family protein